MFKVLNGTNIYDCEIFCSCSGLVEELNILWYDMSTSE